MAEASLFIGLDVSTQSVKAVVYDSSSGKIVARGAAKHSIKESSVCARAEQDPAVWTKGVTSAVRQALESLDAASVAHIRGIGVSGQQHGLVVLDEDGKVLRDAKLWCDLESAAEARDLSEALGATMVPSFTATKILWLIRHEPDVYRRTAHILLPHDYVNYWLTGRMAMECGDASGTGLMDSASRQWCLRAIAAVDDERLRAMLPEIIGPDELLGPLLPDIARRLGLPEGVQVSPGSGDNAMSALGCGAVSEGQMVMSLGTSGTVFGVSSKPLLDPSGLICPFCDATGVWLPLMCTLNCTLVPDEVADMFQADHDELSDAAAKEAVGCEGLNMVPYLVGERTPNLPHATGSLHGLRPGLLRPALLYRAALEGVTYSLLAGLRRMEEQGLRPTELRLVGGGSVNTLWRRIIADAFQLPIRLPVEPETAALGAALQAAACVNHVPVAQYVQQHSPALSEESINPDPAVKEQYEAALDRHVKLSKALFGA